jgi:CRP/FNR family transcriptional regulator
MRPQTPDLATDVHVPQKDARAPFDKCFGCRSRGSQFCHVIQSAAAFSNHPPVMHHIGRGQRIDQISQTHGFLGVIKNGFARKSVIRISGERTLVGMALPGDIIWGISGRDTDYDFEAATDIDICCYDSATVKRHMDANPRFRRLLLKEMDHQLLRVLDLLWRVGTLTSRERIISFLVRSVDVMPTEPLSDGSLVLRMVIDRADWADLTNTAVETISRTLRALDKEGLVTSLSPYRFRIHDLQKLASIAGIEPPTRRTAECDCSEPTKTLLALP